MKPSELLSKFRGLYYALVYSSECDNCKKLFKMVYDFMGICHCNVHLADVIKHEDLMADFAITTLPTFLLFKDGKVLGRLEGNVTFTDIVNLYNHHKS